MTFQNLESLPHVSALSSCGSARNYATVSILKRNIIHYKTRWVCQRSFLFLQEMESVSE